MPSIRDFSGGVLNQELQNRDNGNGVLFDCKNVLSSWNGELRKRTGTKWLKSLEGKTKIIPYRLPNGDDMILLLKGGVINCYKFDSSNELVPYTVITGGSSVSFPTTGWSSNTNGNWTVAGTSTYTGNNNAAYKAVQSGTSYAYNRTDFGTSGSVFYSFYNSSDVVFSGCVFTWTNTDMADANYVFRCGVDPVIQYSDDGTIWTPIQTTVGTPTIESWTTTSSGMIPIKYSHTKYEYSVSNDSYTSAHKYWRVVFTHNYVSGEYVSESGIGVIPYLQITNVGFAAAMSETDLVFNNCPYSDSDFDNIKWSQNDRTLTMACKGKIPYQITISGGVFSGSNFTPSDYSGIWGAIGYPACVTYYQNRLWFGGFDAAPTRVYASAFGEFNKFDIPSPIVATSPIMIDGTEISNVIENMWGGNNALYCLSEDGISMIDAQNAIVATNQIEFKLRNREPVNEMTPTVKDDIMIYLGRDKQKILITDYDFVVQRFKANCISDNYNNFLTDKIKELHYIPRKSSLIYGVLENGQWFASLFDINKSKNAIFPLEIDGKIIDVQPIKCGDDTKLLMITQLPSYQYILEEKFPQPDQKIMDFMSKAEKEEYTENVLSSEECYLDHSIFRHYNNDTSVVEDLPYAENEKIEVIADGMYLGEHVVTNFNLMLYAWSFGTTIYTSTEFPNTTSVLYNSRGEVITDSVISSVVVEGGIVTKINVAQDITLLAYETPGIENEYIYIISGLEPAVFDENGEQIGVADSIHGAAVRFNGATYWRASSYDRQIPSPTPLPYVRSSNDDEHIQGKRIYLDNGAKNFIFGYKYDSYAVLKFVSPYNMRKFPKEISVNFINSGYLEVGNTFDSLNSVLNNLVESVNINNDRILMNGNYTKTLDKQAFETPYVIVRSDKGLPFIITGIDYKVDISNYQGGV